jgi:uncharacterized protein GlcG (DUF336 family)
MGQPGGDNIRMLRTRSVVSLAIVVLAIAGSAPPSLVGQKLVTQKAISLDMARVIAETAVEHCRSIGFHVSVAVIDASGMLKAFLRDEKTGPHTIDLSRRKAYTALTFANRWPSTGAAAKEWGTTLMSPMPNVEGTTGVGGGVPIKAGGEAIGAVGVSGAVGWQNDEACANAGIAKIADKLK